MLWVKGLVTVICSMLTSPIAMPETEVDMSEEKEKSIKRHTCMDGESAKSLPNRPARVMSIQ
jgi:hypothetical protein